MTDSARASLTVRIPTVHVDRATMERLGTALARRLFGKRGNHSEIHLSETQLAAICTLACELGAGTQARRFLTERGGFELSATEADRAARRAGLYPELLNALRAASSQLDKLSDRVPFDSNDLPALEAAQALCDSALQRCSG